jgi:ABC-2 type transport system permease protein
MRLCANEFLKFFRQYKLLGVFGICIVLIILDGNAARGGQHATGAELIADWTDGVASMLFLPILYAMICSDLISSEVAKGTIKMILIRPVSRWSIWLSKWATGVFVSWMILLLLAIGLYVFAGLLNGFGSWSAPAYFGDKMLGESVGLFIIKAYGLQFLNAAAMVTFMLVLSTFVDNVAFAFGIAMATVIGSFLLIVMGGTGAGAGWEKFLFSVQWWLPQHITGKFPVPCSLSASLAIVLGWMIIFSVVGMTRFQYRDFT